MPFVGDDICGFMRDTFAELCARWYQLGALYPFSRSHNIDSARDQDPFAFPESFYVLEAFRNSIKFRYSILKHYFGLFFETKGKGSVIKPLFFEFPSDENAYSHENHFLLGKALLFVPCVEVEKFDVDVYFPEYSSWFSIETGKKYSKTKNNYKLFVKYPAPLDGVLPAFLREGFAVAFQNVENVLSTEDLNKNPNFILYCAMEKMNDTDNNEDKFKSMGFVLGIMNYGNEKLIKKCRKKNCKVNFSVFFSKTKNELDLHIWTEEYNNSILEDIYITSLKLYGVKEDEEDEDNDENNENEETGEIESDKNQEKEKKERILTLDLKNPFKIKEGLFKRLPFETNPF